MKSGSSAFWLLLCFTGLVLSEASAEEPPEPAAAKAIPFDQLGAEAQKQYSGDGIGITPTATGAKLRAVMQDLEGEATPDGLWLTSTADEDVGKPNRFRVKAAAVGRSGRADCPQSAATDPIDDGAVKTQRPTFALPSTGAVRASKDAAVWQRPGVIEEYSVSTDGVRQDFVLLERPPGADHELTVDLEVTGARAEAADYGAKLILNATGRELAYSRLKVTDATGRELAATMEVPAPDRIRLRVNDTRAVYPIRIDPTFSDADWVSLNPGIPGANGTISAIVADGSGNVYVGGYFSFAGTVSANRIAKWDGSSWSALGSGMDGAVLALAVSSGSLYAAGEFSMAGGVEANRIAKWDGSAWSSLGSGMDGHVRALAVSGNDIYAGGSFYTAGGVTVNRIARWNGSAWSALGSGMNNDVYALAVSGSDLYAGGYFDRAGGVLAFRIAKWDGNTWSALGGGLSGSVHALTVAGGNLFAGGTFTKYILKWDGNTWSALGTGMTSSSTSGGVYALAVNGGDLYAGGRFTSAGGVGANNIAKWDGSTWSALAKGMNSSVRALAVSGTEVFAGGIFTTAGGATASHITKWDGSVWSALGTGMDGAIYALAVSGSDLYAGGNFTSAGGVANTKHIAKWDGSIWSALGTGMDYDVYALAVSGGNLYAGGWFTSAGGVADTKYIAKWDGSTWSALGTGMNNVVYTLAVSGSDLYAGGSFTRAGIEAANRIAKWNGSAWAQLSAGMDDTVRAMVTRGGDLYAGGRFTTAGGAEANRIAKWNGGAWAPLGKGMNSGVYALAVSGNDLFAGGDFDTAGDVEANFIAKWNGTAWSSVGTGVDGFVRALAVSGYDLYAGGAFATAGGVTASNIAKWNGITWSALGSGVNKSVFELATDAKGQLFVGGNFTLAGTAASPYIAMARIPLPPDPLSLRYLYNIGDSVHLVLDFLPLAPGEILRVLGLPAGLSFDKGTLTISGTVLAMASNRGVQIQVLKGSKVVRTLPLDFAVEPYPFAGSYEMLLEEGGQPVGKLKVTVASPTPKSPTPAFTATLQRVGEPKRSAKGKFISSGSPQTVQIAFPDYQKIHPAVTYDLRLNKDSTLVNATTYPLATTVRGFRLAKAGLIPDGNPKLTLSLPPAEAGDRVATPGGIGYATGSVNSKALIPLSGLLGDARPFTASLCLSQTNQAVLWLTPYTDKASHLGGIIDIGDLGIPGRVAPTVATASGLKWRVYPDPKSKAYPAGFGPLDLTASTSRWHPQTPAEALAQSLGLDFRNVHARYLAPTGDILPSHWSLRDNFTFLPLFPADAVPFSGRAIGSKGTFTGTLKLPAPAASSPMSGVLLQDEAFGKRIGQGLIKVPITAPVKGSFQTLGIELEN